MKKLLSILAGGALVALFALSTNAATVGSNGSFETGINPGIFTALSSGDSVSINDWNVASGSVDYIGSYWQPADGDKSLDLNGDASGSIAQTFVTVPGASYAVNFKLSGNPGGGPDAKVVRVSASGGSPASQDFSFDTNAKGNTLGDMKWESNTYTFVAGSASTTLTFASQVDGASGPALDDVSIEETLPVVVTHTVTASAGANGSISPSGSISVNNGDDKTFTITADSGYHVNAVLVDSVSVGAVDTYTFNDVSEDHSISASFTADTPNPIETFTIKARAGFNGSISPSGKIAVNSGEDQTFTITPKDGFKVWNVLVDGSFIGAVNSYTFSDVNANHYILAFFKRIKEPGDDKDDCKRGGWRNFFKHPFRNQGKCVSSMNHHNKDNDNKNEDNDAEIHGQINANVKADSDLGFWGRFGLALANRDDKGKDKNND